VDVASHLFPVVDEDDGSRHDNVDADQKEDVLFAELEALVVIWVADEKRNEGGREGEGSARPPSLEQTFRLLRSNCLSKQEIGRIRK